jgi:uncharacterized protein YcbK (DUF882 family)
MEWDAKRWPNFQPLEFACRCGCGEVKMDPKFMDWLQYLRTTHGKAMVITSGYRCPEHPVEKKKTKPGSHTAGKAVDVAFFGGSAGYALLRNAILCNAAGIGFKLSGATTFMHLDMMDSRPEAPRPVIWDYV